MPCFDNCCLSSILIVLINCLKSSTSKVPRFSKQLKTIALTCELKVLSIFSLIGFKLFFISSSTHFCNFEEIRSLFSVDINSVFNTSVSGE